MQPSIRLSRQIDNHSERRSPHHTPKTITSTRKSGRSNIFAESPGREKSSSKIGQDTKIEVRGPKHSFSKQSNKKLMITAITYVCLPGELNRKER